MKSARSVVFDLESLTTINDHMVEKKLNFSRAVNYLVKNGSYAIEKMQELRKTAQETLKQQEFEINEGQSKRRTEK